MGFSPAVAEQALVACGRHCCLCHKFCGTKIELHHIVPRSDGGMDEVDNCIPLCFDCHAEVEHYNVRHPRGRKFTAAELRAHRDQWYARQLETSASIRAPESMALDRQVYARLKEILPSDGSIHFIRFNNFAGFSFPLTQLGDLDRFVYACEFPEFEFIDPDHEGLRADLHEHIRAFLQMIGVNTWPLKEPGERRNTVPPEWEYEQPDRFDKVVDELHQLTSRICDTYDAIVRLARRRLGVA